MSDSVTVEAARGQYVEQVRRLIPHLGIEAVLAFVRYNLADFPPAHVAAVLAELQRPAPPVYVIVV